MTPFWLIVLVLIMAIPLMQRLYRDFIRAPIRIRSNQLLQATPKYEHTRPDHLTPEMQEFLGQMIHQFRPEGFEVAANIFEPTPAVGVSVCQVLLVNRVANDTAIIPIVRTQFSRKMVFGIGSRFSSGERIVTMASDEVGIFPHDPANNVAKFSWVTTPATLYEVHRRRVTQAALGTLSRVVPSPGQEIPFFQQVRQRELAWYERCGYLYLDSEANVYHYTWRGAFLAAWKSVGWIKRWRKGLQNRRMRRLWNELRMDQWERHDREIAREPASPVVAQALPAGDCNPELTHGNPVGNSPSAPLQNDERLQYRSSFIGADFDRGAADGSVTIRLRRPSLGHLLAARALSVIVLIIFLPSIIASGFLSWTFWVGGVYVPLFNPWVVAAYLLLCIWIMWSESRKLFRAFWRLRGTMTATGTREGVQFENAPGRRRQGRIARRDIERFVIVMESRLLVKLYRLEMKCRDGAQPLFVSTNQPLLHEVARSLLEAMGRTLAPQMDSVAIAPAGADN